MTHPFAILRPYVCLALLALVALACALPPALAQQAPSAEAPRHFLWRMSRPGEQGYLLGSIHFGTEDLYPMPAPIEQAFADSSVLAVEVNLLDIDPGALSRRVLTDGMYPSLGNNLRHHVRPETWALLEQVAAQSGMPIEYLQQQKPWMAAMTLVQMVARREGYREDLGIDLHFLLRARGEGKPIRQLETLDQQLSLFDGLSGHEQDTFLFQTLRDMERGPVFFADMFDAWRRGDAGRLDALMNESLHFEGAERLYHLMLTDRNHAMAGGIQALLEQGGTPFVVVGAGHMGGPDGLLRLMSERGYDIEQL